MDGIEIFYPCISNDPPPLLIHSSILPPQYNPPIPRSITTYACNGLKKRVDGWNGNMSGGRDFASSVVDISEHMYM